MAQSIKLGNDTYLDASGVEMNASSSPLRRQLSDWGGGMFGFIRKEIPDGNSATFTFQNSAKAVIFCDGVASTGKQIYIVAATSAGTMSYKAIATESTNLTVATDTNTFTITNGTGAVVYTLAVVFFNTVS